MNTYLSITSSVGGKLVLSICTILLLTILSVLVATIAIKKIDTSQRNLTEKSLPALAEVNQLSGLAINIVKNSLLMTKAINQDELNGVLNNMQTYISELKLYVKKLEKYDFPEELTININEILKSVNTNVDDIYVITNKKIKDEKDIRNKVSILLNSIDIIQDNISIIKINADNIFLNKLENSKFLRENDLYLTLRNEIYDIELLSSIILHAGELRKDLNFINTSVEKDKIYSTRQEFNHSLRKIVRVLVQSDRHEIKKSIGDNVNELISLGQDSPDIFDNKLELIELSLNLEKITQENILLTQQLNTAIFTLVNQVKDKALISSRELHETISYSESILYAIALVALIISLLISWLFIYKRIVVKLLYLSHVTKKLSNNEFNFNIDTSGEAELKDISLALNSLKTHSLKQHYLNKQLAKQSLKLRQSNEDLSQFAYIASHDLQEPLRMVGSYVQLLKKRYQGKIDDKADLYINFAVDGCVRMKDLIEGLLEYSRVESSNEEMQEFDTNRLLDDVKQDLRVKIKERNAQVIINKLPFVRAIPSQVRVVFANLINNGLKYCAKENPLVIVDAVIDGDMAKFYVRDNGIGVKEKYHDKIFVIFKRLHSRAEYSGTGIGLSICKKIIERHGGYIKVKSTPNYGSTFIFTLPLAKNNEDQLKIAI